MKSRSCSKAVPTLQHTIYGKQNKRSRKIGFEHYRPKRIIVNTSCSVQGLPWAPSAFKAEKGNIKLEQQPGFTVCFLTCLVRWGSLYLWQSTGRALPKPCSCSALGTVTASQSSAKGQTQLCPARAALCPSIRNQLRAGMEAHSSHPSSWLWQFWQRHVLQRALKWDRNRLLHRTGFQLRLGLLLSGGTAPRPRQTGTQAHPLRSGITAKTPRGRAQGTQASVPRGRGSSSGCSRASPSLPSPRAAAPTLQELYRKSPGRADCQLTELFSQQPAREERPPPSILPGSFPWYQGKKRSLAPQPLPRTANARSIRISEKFVELCT